jgi:L-alanine-DL-glutamate epimerase-like enolase superfamily enzyme
VKITDISWIHSGRAVYVKIATDKDITGYGEATNFAPRSVIGLIEEIRPYLLGEDPRRIEHLWQESFRRLFARGGPITGSALAGIDMALWDIKGKELDAPVYELLGGLARTRVRLYGHVTGHSAEEIAANAKRLADRGVTAIRYRGFHDMDAKGLHDHQRAVRQQVEYTEAIRSAVGDDVDLIIECHGRYDPDHAVQLARQVAEFNPLYIEDPVRHENPQAFRYLRSHTGIPLATGERGHSKWDFRELVVDGLVDYVRPDICWAAGFTEMKKIAALAEVYYVNLVPHNTQGPLGSAASLHASLAISNVALMEAPFAGRDPDVDVVSPWPVVEDGYALPPTGPGLGVEFHEDAVAPPAEPRRQHPVLRALDGSVRDW